MLGDDEAGLLELEAARELFERLGAAPDVTRTSPATTDQHGLSDRELEVLRLLASGKSNREIASTLVLSEHTVARSPAEHLRKARPVVPRRSDRVRIRARARVVPSGGQK